MKDAGVSVTLGLAAQSMQGGLAGQCHSVFFLSSTTPHHDATQEVGEKIGDRPGSRFPLSNPSPHLPVTRAGPKEDWYMQFAWLVRPGRGPLASTAGTGLMTEAKAAEVCGWQVHST